jgi:hypothetical protein
MALLKSNLTKNLAKQVGKMKVDRPKLYRLILEHMSMESRDKVSQEPDYEDWHNATDPEELWQVIVKTHKVDCVSNITQVQYSKEFRETYRNYKNTLMEEKERAMEFFHGLDQGRYAVFKTNMLNGWAAGAFNPPDTINKIFRIVGSWVKPVLRGEGGTAILYVMSEEDAKQVDKKKQEQKQKQKQEATATAAAAIAEPEANEESKKKLPKDRSNYKC